jgi:hypothetical protein
MTMVQVAWSALGLLAVAVFAMFGMFFYLGGRIDALGDSLRGEIGRLRAELRGEIAQLGGRLDAHIERHAG